MRLWSLHPKYLDSAGIISLWREALLAQKVLMGRTRGYRHHPQLERFKKTSDPAAAIAEYLRVVFMEGSSRDYHFDSSKITGGNFDKRIPVTSGQLIYELGHLRDKLMKRSREELSRLQGIKLPDPHPLFIIVPGPIEAWEKVCQAY